MEQVRKVRLTADGRHLPLVVQGPGEKPGAHINDVNGERQFAISRTNPRRCCIQGKTVPARDRFRSFDNSCIDERRVL